MDELLLKVKQEKCLSSTEVEHIKDLLHKNFVRTPKCLTFETVESLEEIGINKRVGRSLLGCLVELETPSTFITTEKPSKDQEFKAKMEKLIEEEPIIKIQFELINNCEVFDPVAGKIMKLGAAYKISNIKSKIKAYKTTLMGVNDLKRQGT